MQHIWKSRSLRALDIFRPCASSLRYEGRGGRKISNARFRDPISKLRKGLFLTAEQRDPAALIAGNGRTGKPWQRRKPAEKPICQNKRARINYFIDETYEAGIALVGTEVKALRDGRANLKDSYALIREGELFLYDVHISPYSHGNRENHNPLRVRKLLMHRQEIKRLYGKSQERGLATDSAPDVLQEREDQGGDRRRPREEALR